MKEIWANSRALFSEEQLWRSYIADQIDLTNSQAKLLNKEKKTIKTSQADLHLKFQQQENHSEFEDSLSYHVRLSQTKHNKSCQSGHGGVQVLTNINIHF